MRASKKCDLCGEHIRDHPATISLVPGETSYYHHEGKSPTCFQKAAKRDIGTTYPLYLGNK